MKDSPLLVLKDVLTDVTLREGSQQERDLRGVSIADKILLFDRLAKTGLKTFEVTAFAPGEWFRDAQNLLTGADALHHPVSLRALYFNTRGLDDLIEASTRIPSLLKEGVFHTAASTNYRIKNYKQGDLPSVLSKMQSFMEAFRKYSLTFDTILISTAWGEEHEAITPAQLLSFCEQLFGEAKKGGFNVKSLTLADTVGFAMPEAIQKTIVAVKSAWPSMRVRAHLHPASSHALDCVLAALEAGVDEWEAALGGVGGSPFASDPGANLDIRWLLRAWNEKKWEHGLSETAVQDAIEFLSGLVKREIPHLARIPE